MIGPAPLDQIMLAWSDDLHMKPVNNPYYKHIGAGVSEYQGTVYYIVQAAYTSNNIYKPGTPQAQQPTNSDFMSQIIFPVQIATPQADGRVIHLVKQGQTLWSIAIAYNTKIAALTAMNNLAFDNPIIYVGQKLYIPITVKPQTVVPSSTVVEPTCQTPIHTSQAKNVPAIVKPTKAVVPDSSSGGVSADLAAVYSLILLCIAGVAYIFRAGLIKVK
jgi:LysM repeat protein